MSVAQLVAQLLAFALSKGSGALKLRTPTKQTWQRKEPLRREGYLG